MDFKQSHNLPTGASSPVALEALSPDRTGRDQNGRRVQSAELFARAHELEIEHNGAVYRLRKTSLGKLILTK